ncbi:unannotated protein [freshwater metagenome]|uniref:Unannotated protein n=1 Tax=freshwater metagenome TaxID=449393 RepID=A0A6J6T7A6_9ZZZZ
MSAPSIGCGRPSDLPGAARIAIARDRIANAPPGTTAA